MDGEHRDDKSCRGEMSEPADPPPLRFGRGSTHETADCVKVCASFDAIMAIPADPMARAVALHGNGNMTIHEGEFKKV